MKIEELKPKDTDKPEVTFLDVEQDGVFPEGALLTTNQIEFYNLNGQWVLPEQPRMDGVVRRKVTPEGEVALEAVEMNKLKQGDQVIKGSTEDGSEGVIVTNFKQPKEEKGSMAHHASMEFNTNAVSRERIINYGEIADMLEQAKGNPGKIIWVLGPAVVHAGGIKDMAWLVKNGFVGALFAGNALAAHDIEHAMKGTSLGVNDRGQAVHNGHRNHLETINDIRRVGSIANAVDRGLITEGIMYECVKNGIPFVLAPSPRDDGPLPDVIVNELEAQDAMREYTKDASLVVMGATVLHSIATGNMTPTYRVDGDEINPIPIVCVDTEEFVVTKLSDRGTSQAVGVISNITDFLARLRTELERRQNQPDRRLVS